VVSVHLAGVVAVRELQQRAGLTPNQFERSLADRLIDGRGKDACERMLAEVQHADELRSAAESAYGERNHSGFSPHRCLDHRVVFYRTDRTAPVPQVDPSPRAARTA